MLKIVFVLLALVAPLPSSAFSKGPLCPRLLHPHSSLRRPLLPHNSSPRTARLLPPLRATKQPKWLNENVNETLERFESVKTAALSAVAGSLAVAPVAVLAAALSSSGFDAQWEFSIDMLAATLALFGITYRYAVRADGNPNLKQGVVGAFALTRTLNLIHVDVGTCTSLPLHCGAPLGYVSWDMIWQGVGAGVPSFVAFGSAALALEACFDSGFVRRFE